MARRDSTPRYSDSVFLNVPFDIRYRLIFRGIVFAIHDCGFESRCALETSDAGQVRIEKLYRIIEECRYGIHDISRTTLDYVNHLPRFNMPLELGVFLGARRFGEGANRQKACLIFDRERYRYQKFCSDLSGQDIRAHGDRVRVAIGAVRDWLSSLKRTPELVIPGGNHISDRFEAFCKYLPKGSRLNGIKTSELTFLDFRTLLATWLDVNPW